MKDLYAISYVPGAGQPGHAGHLDLLKDIQSAGKVVHVAGATDEIKFMHKELRPELVAYFPSVESQEEGEELLTWLVRNT